MQRPQLPLSPSTIEVAECIAEDAAFALEHRIRGKKWAGGVKIITPNPSLKFDVVRIADEYGLPTSRFAKTCKDLIYMALAHDPQVCASEILSDLDLLIGTEPTDE